MAFTLIGSDSMVADGGVNTNLQNHTPSGTNALASNWVHLQWQKPAVSSVVEAADNTCCQPYAVGASFYNPYVIGPTSAAVQKTQFTLGTTTTSTLKGLIVLASNAVTNWNGYIAFFNGGNGQFTIERVDNGVLTSLAVAAGSVSATDVLSLEVSSSGVLTLRQNGTSVVTATDTTYTTGQPGIALKETYTSGGISAYSAYQDTSGGGSTVVSRRTLSPLGTRVGSRQAQAA